LWGKGGPLQGVSCSKFERLLRTLLKIDAA
jgi:hypothetical protein